MYDVATIPDSTFRAAIKAIDDGDLTSLTILLDTQPHIITEPVHFPDGGYFEYPYLLYFIADNPIRNGRLPANVIDILERLLNALSHPGVSNAKEQLDYTLGLVATGRTPKESGHQIGMMEMLVKAGATPANSLGALAQHNIEAALWLEEQTGRHSLAVAVCTGQSKEAEQLIETASEQEKTTALIAAAYYANDAMVKWLISRGVDVNAIPERNGFHHHATALHQAVAAPSLSIVKMLAEAGASLVVEDAVYDGTPYDWAVHLRDNNADPKAKEVFNAIADYLTTLSATNEKG